jgi:hypothetical protein
MAITAPQERPGIVRDSDAGSYLERFLVCAILSMLAIRAYLRLTGYPQIGGRGLHIAHMLWGGAMMVGAVFILLACLGRRAKQFAATLAGIGFGFFIDELGKFITRDNNYFFRPTFGIIYLIFVALYLLSRAIARLRPLSRREYLVNAVDMVIDLLEDGATPEEAARALSYVQRSGVESALAEGLRETIGVAASRERERPSPRARFWATIRRLYRRWTGRRRFEWMVGVVFAADGLLALLLAIGLVVALGEGALHVDQRSFVALGCLAASALAAGMILVGAVQLPRSRRAAYRWFKDAMLVSIFVVQPYQFFEDQLGALGGLTVDFVLLVSVNYLLREAAAERRGGIPDGTDVIGSAEREGIQR